MEAKTIKSTTDCDWRNLNTDIESPRYLTIARYIKPRSSVLDVGCGDGTLAQYIPSCEYVGIEPSLEAAEAAWKKNLNVFNHGSEELSITKWYEDAEPIRYDHVVFNESLYYMEYPFEELGRYAALVRRGGNLIVSIYQKPRHWFRKSINVHVTEALRGTLRCIHWNYAERDVHSGSRHWKVFVIQPE